MAKKELIINEDLIIHQIYIIRGQKVMLDSELAALYGVETKQLKRQVNRNIRRFPADFMFELTKEEQEILRCQFGTLRWGQHTKYLPMAFTEQGVAMLSSVLNSDKAVEVNIQIIRVFTKMRQMLMDNTELRLEIEKIKRKLGNHGKNIELVFDYLDELLTENEKRKKAELKPKPTKRIGYKN
jgi:phage regulator Rha-like protein